MILDMTRRGFAVLFVTLALVVCTAVQAEEPPSLAAAVAAGKLPPLAQRLPLVPLVFEAPRPDWSLCRPRTGTSG
jgi:hypothetical protein